MSMQPLKQGLSRLAQSMKRAAVVLLRNEWGILPDGLSQFRRGLNQHRKGRLDEAIINYNRAVVLQPDLVPAYCYRAIAKADQGKADEALADYDRAIAIDAKNVDAYINRGNLKTKRGDQDGAILDFDRALELRPDCYKALNGRGLAKAAKGDFSGAIREYTAALEIKPDQPIVYSNRADVSRRLGDLDMALTDCNKAIELDATLAPAYVVRSLIKRIQNDLDGAVVDCVQAIQLKGDFAAAYYTLAGLRKAQGLHDAALLAYAKAIEFNPELKEVYYARGCLYYNQQKWTEALSDFGTQYKPPQSHYAQLRIWLVRARIGERAMATAALRLYLETTSDCSRDLWPVKIGLFLLGGISEVDFFAAAQNSDKKLENEQLCEAFFYAGTVSLVEANKSKAADYFKNCVATDIKNFSEHTSALAELEHLQKASP